MRVEKYYVTHPVLFLGSVPSTLPNVLKTKVWPKVPLQNKYVFKTALTKIDVLRKLALQNKRFAKADLTK